MTMTNTITERRVRQWEWLLQTQNVSEPHDAEGLFDILMNDAINENLSDVDVNLILRRLRSLVDDDSAAATTSTSNLIDAATLVELLPKGTPVLENFGRLAQSLCPAKGRGRTEDGFGGGGRVSFTAVAALLGVSRSTKNRDRRLQLLFYLLVDGPALEDCLLRQNTEESRITRPRQPTAASWLLEVGQGITINVDSLMHYQTHGTAFLPVNNLKRDNDDDETAGAGVHPFIADPSQSPVSVRLSRIHDALARAGGIIVVEDDSKQAANKSDDVPSDLMVYLQCISDGKMDDPYFDSGAAASLSRSIQSLGTAGAAVDSGEMWTTQDFFGWAQDSLDDRALDVVFHRLLTQGVLPSPALELDLVRTRWLKWQKDTDRYPNERDGDDPRRIGNVRDVMSLCCVDRAWWDSWTSYVGWRFHGEAMAQRSTSCRPHAISNQRLADATSVQHGVHIGSGNDAEYVPPCVWGCLYELYAGGPPVSCWILPFESDGKVTQIEYRHALTSDGSGGANVSPALGACGLINLGKSAWMNSVLQLMNATPLLRSYLLGNTFKVAGHVNRTNPLGSRGSLIEALARAMQEMRTSESGTFKPSAFGYALAQMNGQFRVTIPQDVQEFLTYLTDIIHEDVNLVRNKPYVKALEDDWVQNHSLQVVQRAAWLRFLRRNRSIMTDLVMGHALHTTKCSVCGYSSRHFDPFTVLSIPIPTEMKVSFKCTLIRRAHLERDDASAGTSSTACPTYIVDIPRLADVSEVGAKISILSGIPKERLRLYESSEVLVDDTNALSSRLLPKIRVKLHRLRTKPALPNLCKSDLIVFETTLNPRRLGLGTSARELSLLLAVYGDTQECHFVDTDPLPLAKAVSVRTFSQLQKDLVVGARVDCRDDRGKWYPGSIVEARVPSRQFRVHFDNFDPKWDEVYTIADIGTKVNPLHSQTMPNPRNLELMVYNSSACAETGAHALFGQPFYIDGFKDWSCARFGAHILVQAFRSVDASLLTSVHSAVSGLVDLLVSCDKDRIRGLLAMDGENTTAPVIEKRLSDELPNFLERLPFGVQVGVVGKDGEPDFSKNATPFPFSLTKTSGNCFSIRNVIILQWVPRRCGEPTTPMILYREPEPLAHESYTSLLSNEQKKVHGAVSIGDCMNELCKQKKIHEIDGWTCPRCEAIREGGQALALWRLPDVLMIQIKRFNMTRQWQEKLMERVDFPLFGLDVSPWCHQDAPLGDNIYDLIGTIDHYIAPGASVGHYTNTCKATACTPKGTEEVVYNFAAVDAPRDTESMWLRFDDEDVKPVNQEKVVSSQAYILMYRRRQQTASNIAKYSTLQA